MLHQALRDLSQWVEQGVAPPESTHYEVVDGQVVVPADAPGRRGIQPVVRLTANGAARADVEPGRGGHVAGHGRSATGHRFDRGRRVGLRRERHLRRSARRIEPAPRVEVERRWSSAERGTHFPVVRVVAQRDGDATTPYARLQNLARARVVVS